MPTEVYGIDFSGSKSPGQNIWITEAIVSSAPEYNLKVQDMYPAADRFSGEHRNEILTDLCDFIRQKESAVVGIDFPFGFPSAAVTAENWTGFLGDFSNTFKEQGIDDFPGRYGANGRLKRETDFRFGGQSPLSPQVQYQVLYGLRDVLYPLVTENEVSVAPMQPYDPT